MHNLRRLTPAGLEKFYVFLEKHGFQKNKQKQNLFLMMKW